MYFFMWKHGGSDGHVVGATDVHKSLPVPDSKGTLAQRQIMVGMVGQRRRWAIYVGPTLGQPGIAMRNIRLWLV